MDYMLKNERNAANSGLCLLRLRLAMISKLALFTLPAEDVGLLKGACDSFLSLLVSDFCWTVGWFQKDGIWWYNQVETMCQPDLWYSFWKLPTYQSDQSCYELLVRLCKAM